MASNQSNRIGAELRRFAASKSVKVVRNVTNHLVKDTPRDTSLAANNWIPASGFPHRTVEGSPREPTLGSAIREAALISLAAGYKLTDGNLYISDNTSYINSLNTGQTPTRKAPVGFVQIGIAKGVEQSKR